MYPEVKKTEARFLAAEIVKALDRALRCLGTSINISRTGSYHQGEPFMSLSFCDQQYIAHLERNWIRITLRVLGKLTKVPKIALESPN